MTTSTVIALPEFVQGGRHTWSVSRNDTFQRCRRRFWLQYYASLRDSEIARLKELSSLDLWIGSVVHDTLETFLKLNDSIPPKAAQEALIHRVIHGQLVQDWNYSLANAKRFRLFEHEYGVQVTQDEKRVRVGILTRSLRNFFAGPILAEAMAVGRKNWITIDEVKEYSIEGVAVFGAIDFAFRRADGRVVVCDWKTGRSEGRSNQAQLAGYALIALQQGWVKTPEEIDTVLSYLALGSDKWRTMTPAIIDKARATIVAAAQAMRDAARDPVKNIAFRDDFPMTTSTWDCQRCAFKKVCYPEPASIAA